MAIHVIGVKGCLTFNSAAMAIRLLGLSWSSPEAGVRAFLKAWSAWRDEGIQLLRDDILPPTGLVLFPFLNTKKQILEHIIRYQVMILRETDDVIREIVKKLCKFIYLIQLFKITNVNYLTLFLSFYFTNITFI